MKNIYKILIVAVLALFTAASCQQFEEVSKIGEIESLTVVVKANLDLGSAPAPNGFNVKLINYAERYEINTTMGANGTVTVKDIIPGIYTITLSSEKAQDGFTYNYSGNVVNVDIVTNNKQISVNVGASKSGALVLKEVYYCGSKTPTGGSYFRDQFYEIYNNSETVQNVRGLCIAILNPLTATENLPGRVMTHPSLCMHLPFGRCQQMLTTLLIRESLLLLLRWQTTTRSPILTQALR